MGQTVSAALITSIIAVVLGGLGLIAGGVGYVQGAAALRRATAARKRAAAAEEAALQARASAEAMLREAEALTERRRPVRPEEVQTGPIALPDLDRRPRLRASATGPVDVPADVAPAPEVAFSDDARIRPASGSVGLPVVPDPGAVAEVAAASEVGTRADPAAADPPGAEVTPEPEVEPEGEPEPSPEVASEPSPDPEVAPEPDADPEPAGKASPEPLTVDAADDAVRPGRGQVAAGTQDAPTMDWAETLRTGAIPLPPKARGTYSAPRRRPKPTGEGPARFELKMIGRQRFEAVNVGGEAAAEAVVEGVGDDPHLVRPLSTRPITVQPGGTLAFSILRVEGRDASVEVHWTVEGEPKQQELPLM